MAPGTDLSILAQEVTNNHSTTLPPKSTKQKTPTTSSKGAKLLDPSLITQDFDSLRFGAAASRQLDTSRTATKPETRPPKPSTFLISSPYNNPGHYLDLSDLDAPNLILAKALTALHPTRADYATADYITSLNFHATILPLVREIAAVEGYGWESHSFYVVIFRSKLKVGSDNELLYKLDYESHREACESGGLLKYWFGKCDGERRNLATCFWRSREDAHAGGEGPWHAKARAAGRTLYESIKFSTHRFTILDGAKELRFEDWKEGDRPTAHA